MTPIRNRDQVELPKNIQNSASASPPGVVTVAAPPTTTVAPSVTQNVSAQALAQNAQDCKVKLQQALQQPNSPDATAGASACLAANPPLSDEGRTQLSAMNQQQQADKAAYTQGMSSPDIAVRNAAAEKYSDGQWNRVDNSKDFLGTGKSKWEAAGLSRDEFAQLAAKARGDALKTVGGNEHSPNLGEAQYLEKAKVLADWASGQASANVKSGNTGNLAQATALREMISGGTEYMESRNTWLTGIRQQAAGAAPQP